MRVRSVPVAVTLLTASLVLLPACRSVDAQRQPASAQTPAADPPEGFGLSVAAAVEVCKPEGERAYLRRLRCADGTAPAFNRRGSGGMRTAPKTPDDERKALDQMFAEKPLAQGEPDYHIVDYYEVRCGSQVTEVVMDMYHCSQEAPEQAPPGFSIVPLP